jgi:intron-binding protein aquarius
MLLGEVDRLAQSIGVHGAHGKSCETATYFYAVYVKHLWEIFKASIADLGDATAIIEKFPFSMILGFAWFNFTKHFIDNYFANAPQTVFPVNADLETVREIADGCFRHIEKIFKELEDVRPFELLSRGREKSHYLLTKEARVIALTSTYAAIKVNSSSLILKIAHL